MEDITYNCQYCGGFHVKTLRPCNRYIKEKWIVLQHDDILQEGDLEECYNNSDTDRYYYKPNSNMSKMIGERKSKFGGTYKRSEFIKGEKVDSVTIKGTILYTEDIHPHASHLMSLIAKHRMLPTNKEETTDASGTL